VTARRLATAWTRHNGEVTKGEELLAEFRRQRRAGDPRLSEEGKAILLRITMGDLADEFADSLAAISEADPLPATVPR